MFCVETDNSALSYYKTIRRGSSEPLLITIILEIILSSIPPQTSTTSISTIQG